MLARDSSSTWTRATRSVMSARGGGAPGRSFTRATRSSCRFSPWRRQEQLLIQPVDVVELESVRPGREEAAEEGLEELLEQHLEALIVIGTGPADGGMIDSPRDPAPRSGSDVAPAGRSEAKRRAMLPRGSVPVIAWTCSSIDVPGCSR